MSNRRTNEPRPLEVEGSTAGASGGRDLERITTPGHPVKEGAGYDCACGECGGGDLVDTPDLRAFCED